MNPLRRYLFLCLLFSALLVAVASAQDLVGKTREVVVPEEQLISDFARTLGLAAEHLAWANDLETTVRLKSGQTVIVPARLVPQSHPQDGAVLNLAERGLYLFENGVYKEFIPVGIGDEKRASYHTPTGRFEIISRVKNPDWVAPESDWAEAMEKDRIDGDSPDNPLGEYWFGFNAPGGGYGLHENTAPRYTGDTVSHGCVRLYPEHARYLYANHLLEPGDEVWIINRPVRTVTADDGSSLAVKFPSVYGATASLSGPGQTTPPTGIPHATEDTNRTGDRGGLSDQR